MRWYFLDREGLSSPDLQLLFTPASYSERTLGKLEQEDGMTVAVCPLDQLVEEIIMAVSSDPFVRPEIRPNYQTLMTYEYY